MPSHSPTGARKRRLRQIAHQLKPVVTVSESGLTDNVQRETDRALSDHELIKVRIDVDERDLRRALGAELAQRCAAETIQVIGKIWVYHRANPDADPRLSNLARAGG